MSLFWSIDWRITYNKRFYHRMHKYLVAKRKWILHVFFSVFNLWLNLAKENNLIHFLQSEDWSIFCCLLPMFVSSITLITLKRHYTLAIQLFLFHRYQGYSRRPWTFLFSALPVFGHTPCLTQRKCFLHPSSVSSS